jgi:predicted nucleotidyltransferase
MAKLAMELSAGELEAYRTGVKARDRKRQLRVDARFEQAWTVARSAASILKARYGIDEVWIFGSLLARRRFHAGSDVDLAVWTLDDDNWLQAIGDLQALDEEFRVDVVELARATDSIRRAVAEEGELL